MSDDGGCLILSFQGELYGWVAIITPRLAVGQVALSPKARAARTRRDVVRLTSACWFETSPLLCCLDGLGFPG